ncbi:Profilin/allergen [Sistotremastrum suecicum HHB10207 ss-3]|uniref:Profilin n=1 Tax=Sistotremastrum suecicum HHB10207 ss-3 TaxID=1314776 RepID=A0A166D993_9AGAM|nr:Profilin/allergen [Sistotremastrum suecicum HHB10207 ss-3]
MSWQAYVDTNLLGSGKVNRAAILGQKGGVWAASSSYTLSAQEQAAAVKLFADPAQAQANGVRLGGQKFFVINANERSVYGKKGGSGCVLVKTKQAVLVAEYDPPTQQTECTTIVEGLADYLIGVSY